jgi:hypothetical protein
MTKINVGDTVCYTYLTLADRTIRGKGIVTSDQPLVGTDYAFAIKPLNADGEESDLFQTIHVRQCHCLLLETRGQRLERLSEQAIAEDRIARAENLKQAIEANRKTFSAKLRTSFYHSALQQ